MIIRALALDEITPRTFFRVIFKELRIALLIGVALAIVNGIALS